MKVAIIMGFFVKYCLKNQGKNLITVVFKTSVFRKIQKNEPHTS